jgi:hypothetical protein
MPVRGFVTTRHRHHLDAERRVRSSGYCRRSPACARSREGSDGWVRSSHVRWEVLPPLTEPGELARVEAPQLVRWQGAYTILFSCPR